MSKVRLYHLAREWDLPEQSMLEVLHEAGHRLKSHFVEVDVQEIAGIRAILEDGGMFEPPPSAEPVQPEPVAAVVQPPPPPPPAPEPVRPEPVRGEAVAPTPPPPP